MNNGIERGVNEVLIHTSPNIDLEIFKYAYLDFVMFEFCLDYAYSIKEHPQCIFEYVVFTCIQFITMFV